MPSSYVHVVAPCLALLALNVVSGFVNVPFEAQMVVFATLLVHAGSHASIAMPQEAGPEDEKEGPMSAKDAALFPIMAGGVLTSLWLAFKYLDEKMVNLLLSAYFVLAAGFAVGTLISWGLGGLSGSLGKKQKIAFRVSIPYVLEASVTWLDVIGVVLGLAIGGAEVWSRIPSAPEGTVRTVEWVRENEMDLFVHGVLNNVVGSCIAVQGVARLSVGRFSTAAVLLAGVFAYDIFMVFGTGMMQSVATKVKGPILLKFLRTPSPDADPSDAAKPYAMLGLGDIVLPGAFVALILRFEATVAKVWKSLHEQPTTSSSSSTTKKTSSSTDIVPVPAGSPGGPAVSLAFPKPIYWATLMLYIVGLLATVAVMLFANHAQPALLYLVPAVLIGSAGAALVTGQVTDLFAYTEESKETEQLEDATIKATVGDGGVTPHPNSHESAKSPNSSRGGTRRRKTPKE